MKNKETNILIFSNVFREIINIFSGPFLTAYFFKISKNSLIDLSTYNIFVFFLNPSVYLRLYVYTLYNFESAFFSYLTLLSL